MADFQADTLDKSALIINNEFIRTGGIFSLLLRRVQF